MRKILYSENWENLRKRHREHLRKLGEINEMINKFLTTIPSTKYESPVIYDGKDMKKAYDELRKWEEKEKEITDEYSKFRE